MQHFRLLRSVSIAVLLLFLVIVGVKPLTTTVAATVAPDAEAIATGDDDSYSEQTCSLGPSNTNSDCSVIVDEYDDDDDESKIAPSYLHRNSIVATHQPEVISLTDDNFDALTYTSTPSTWLIMFKTNSCGICKKAFPILEALSKDADVIRHNCNNGVDYPDYGGVCNEEEDILATHARIDGEDEETLNGPIYIATIDAGWSGRDTTKRFEIDATPTIIVLHNKGYTMDTHDQQQKMNIDSRSYYVYRGQRATYPLRSFVMGGYTLRKQMTMPPPLSDNERKPVSALGRLYEYIISPSAKWAGGILLKIILAWFVFSGILGLFLRIHNYAWEGDDERQIIDNEQEIEKEKARGREEYNAMTTDEKIERRQKLMWERKEKNRAMFAAKREARVKVNTARKEEEDDEDDEQLEGVGVAVKKSDAKKILRESRKKYVT